VKFRSASRSQRFEKSAAIDTTAAAPVATSLKTSGEAESVALLADEVLPRLPIRQWVLSVPYALRFLCASRDLERRARRIEGDLRGIGVEIQCHVELAPQQIPAGNFSRADSQSHAPTLEACHRAPGALPCQRWRCTRRHARNS
jgi:hypothetical protein